MLPKVFNSYERSKDFVQASTKDKLPESKFSPKRDIVINANLAFHVNLSPEVKLPLIGNIINPITGAGSLLFRFLFFVIQLVLGVWIGGFHV